MRVTLTGEVYAGLADTPGNLCPSNCSQWCPSPLSQPLHHVLHNAGHATASAWTQTLLILILSVISAMRYKISLRGSNLQIMCMSNWSFVGLVELIYLISK